MKYAFIAALLGWTETPDTHGIFLQPEEVAKVDKDLELFAAAKQSEQKAASDLIVANTTIGELNTSVETLNGSIATMKADADTAAQTASGTIANRDARITELEAEVKALGGQSSGSGTAIQTNEDVTPKTTNSSFFAYDSPEHPANQVADKFFGKRN